jgi:predicted nucleotidyltransferase
MEKIPKELLNSKYRKEMWKNVSAILNKIEKKIPVASVHLLGSFTTKKTRPADVDFIVLVKTKADKSAKWSTDLVIAPDNEYGEDVLEDAKKWMKQKYGTKKSAVIKLK